MSDRAIESSRKLFAIGWGIIALVFGGLIIWSVAAPFEGAVITTGSITVEGHNKAVQHLDGGLVSEILVTEDSVVSEGQILIRLNGDEISDALSALDARLFDLAAREARLSAERDGVDQMQIRSTFSEFESVPALQEAMLAQTRYFEARRSSQSTTQSVLSQKAIQLRRRIEGLRAGANSNAIQADLLGQEITGLETLLAKGLVPKARVLALRRQKAQLTGDIQSIEAETAALRVEIGETDLLKLQSREDFQQEAASDLTETKTQISELLEKRTTLLDRQRRLDIRAPNSGRVIGIQAHTVGGIIAPTEPIMHIVPQDRNLVAIIRISPQDIDKVSVGQHVSLRFSAFSQSETPEIFGAMIRVSADTIIDPATGFPYYEGVVELPTQTLSENGITLVPGMPVDVLVRTENRSVLSYLIKPARDAMSKSFRE